MSMKKGTCFLKKKITCQNSHQTGQIPLIVWELYEKISLRAIVVTTLIDSLYHYHKSKKIKTIETKSANSTRTWGTGSSMSFSIVK